MKWFLSAIVIIFSISASAQSVREPWLVPLEERIAARTLRQQGAEQQHFVTVDDLSGKTNPELFLPYEVFRKLIRLAYTTPPRFSQVFREDRAKHLKQFPPDFRDQLRAVSSPYIAELWREEDIGRGRRSATKAERADTLPTPEELMQLERGCP